MNEIAMKEKAVSAAPVPFDTAMLDDLLDKAGIDVLVVNSKHNIRYLLGGYRFFFFAHFDAIGLSRYLPILIYERGRLDHAAYIGNSMERYEKELGRFWTPEVLTSTWNTAAAIRLAAEHLRKAGLGGKRIGVERSFLPADAEEMLRKELPEATLVEAQIPLERLRARKTPEELGYLREASDRVVAAMLAVIAGHGPGATKLELTEALVREEAQRGLEFDYLLITAGTSHNRAPSSQVWGEGDILSLDSGGNYKGYIGDLCRMAIQGEPDAELIDLLGEIDAIQMAARTPIRAGAQGGDIYAAAEPLVQRSAHGNSLEFVAHGMGLTSHEAPRLSSHAPPPYPGDDADRPLQSGMIISIETTLAHPRRGYIKIEDTVAVTDTGWEGFGDQGRGWNRGGTAVKG